MRRNESMLEFQRRLIRVAMRSPRKEAMNMLGIVWKNLEEFAEVRIPLDDEPETIISAYVETLELFNMAIARKFPRLYAANSMATIDDARKALLGCYEAPAVLDDTIRKRVTSLAKFIYQESTPVGIMHRGQFYHRLIVREVLKPFRTIFDADGDFDRDIMTRWNVGEYECFMIVGNAAAIAAPATETGDDTDALEAISNWLRNRDRIDDDRVCVVFEPVVDSDEDSMRAETEYSESNGARKIRVRIQCDNPIMLKFNEVAKTILGSESARKIVDYVKYANEDEKYGINDVTYEMKDAILIRTPTDPRNIYEKLFEALGLMNYFKEFTLAASMDDINALATRIRTALRGDMYSTMSIYRTGTDIDDLNYRFCVLMAKVGMRQAEFLIEARAREDEENNLRLYYLLERCGANVHLVTSNYSSKKVHAKVWAFHRMMTVPDIHVSLYSTGNFVESAQRGFADTILIESTTGHHRTSTDIFWNDLFYPHRVTDAIVKNEIDLTWRPGMIRKRLLDAIRYMKIHAKDANLRNNTSTPFIWIKVNHLTDPKIMRALIHAAHAGVEVRILARTTCLLSTESTPSKMSIRSVAGKFLEHDRWFIFGERHGIVPVMDCDVYISSADLMERNLDNRIEFMKRAPDDFSDTFTAWFDRLFNDSSNPDIGFFNFEI